MYNQNEAILEGIVEKEFTYVYSRTKKAISSQQFYECILKIKRKSEGYDYVIVRASKLLLDGIYSIQKGETIRVEGIVLSEKCVEKDGKEHLKVFVRATHMSIPQEKGKATNIIYLAGKIAKKKLLRIIPKTEKIIMETVIENEILHKKSLIPVNFWDNDARKVASYAEGSLVKLTGRFQTRNSTNESPYGETEVKVAYEISAMKLGFKKTT